MKKMMKNKGITLVALVITIIILLILAGISISALTGSGLFENAKLAAEKSKEAQEKENEILLDYKEIINSYLSGTSTTGDEKDYASTDISEYEPVVDEINASTITVSVPEIEVTDSVSIVGYAYLLNGQVQEYTTETSYTFENLEPDTTYKIKIIAMDSNGKIKTSKEMEMTTGEIIYLYNKGNEYEALTGGWGVQFYTGTNSGVGSATKESNYIDLKTWGTWCQYGASTINTIDFTNINRLYIDISDVSLTSTGYDQLNIIVGSSIKEISSPNITSGRHYIDMTEIDGSYAVAITADNGASFKLNSVWLEETLAEYDIKDVSTENADNYNSTDINSYEPIVSGINASSIKITAPEIKVNNSGSIVGYAYLINGKVKGYTKDTEYTFENLEPETTYKINIIAMDNNGKIKSSKEIEVTTAEVTYLYNIGDENETLTGGWEVKFLSGDNSTVGSATKETNYIDMKTWGTWCQYGASTINTIDFTNVSKIGVEISDVVVEATGYGYMRISVGSISKEVIYTEITDGIYYLDTTSVQGNYTVIITAENGVSYKLNKVWIID